MENASGGPPREAVRIRAFFDQDHPAAAASSVDELLAEGRFAGSRALGSETIADGRWAERWVASLAPFDVGERFTVVPVPDSGEACPAAPVPAVPGARFLLPICPSRAFGTGEHPTTRSCLLALESLDLRDRSLLDVGTGSGILAMAAVVLGSEPVVALDNDPEALPVARDNARLLPAAERIRFLCGGPDAVAARFDTVVANLNSSILDRVLPALLDRLDRGGTLVLSGLLEEETATMAEAVEGSGMRRVGILIDSGWGCTIHERSHA